MKTLIRIIALLVANILLNAVGFSQPAATPAPPHKTEADKILAKGIITVDDFKRFLIAAGTWSWDIAQHRNQTIKFMPDGTAIHTQLVMKYAINGIGDVTVRHPNGKFARIKFTKDYSRYDGMWDKTVPLGGTRRK